MDNPPAQRAVRAAAGYADESRVRQLVLENRNGKLAIILGASIDDAVGENPLLDPVPLRGARRIVVDVEHEPGLVGELLQLDLPQPDARAVRAAAVGGDRQLTRIRITLAP